MRKQMPDNLGIHLSEPDFRLDFVWVETWWISLRHRSASLGKHTTTRTNTPSSPFFLGLIPFPDDAPYLRAVSLHPLLYSYMSELAIRTYNQDHLISAMHFRAWAIVVSMYFLHVCGGLRGRLRSWRIFWKRGVLEYVLNHQCWLRSSYTLAYPLGQRSRKIMPNI